MATCEPLGGLAVTHANIQAVAGTVRASCTLVLSCGTLYVFLSHRTYTPVHVECVAATLLCRHELRKCSRTLSLNSGLQAVLFRDPKSESTFRPPKRGPPRRNPTVGHSSAAPVFGPIKRFLILTRFLVSSWALLCFIASSLASLWMGGGRHRVCPCRLGACFLYKPMCVQRVHKNN